MDIPFIRKPCQCSSDCPKTLDATSPWRYAWGHSPSAKAKAKRGSKPEVRSFVGTATSRYSESISTLKVELDLLTKEIDRLETQATEAEATARAARDRASGAATRHGVVSETIYNLNLLLGNTAEE